MFTALQLYYLALKEKKAEFREKIIKESGIAERTFYTLMYKQPDKLMKELLAKETGIAVDKLYEVVNPQNKINS